MEEINEIQTNEDVKRTEDEESDGIWGSGEGYTPLAEWAQAGGGNGLLSTGPMSDEETMGGTFYANLQAFHVAAAQSSDDDEDPAVTPNAGYRTISNDVSHEERTEEGPGASRSQQIPEVNFRSVADQALLALEEDYRMTLQVGKDKTGIEANFETEALPPSFAAEFDAARRTKSTEILSTQVPFLADFEDVRENVPIIDAETVRKAVQNLRIRPQVQGQMDKWEREQKRLASTAPLRHPWIPDTNCRMFRKPEDATETSFTQTLSRSATLCHAMHRLHLGSSSDDLIVHILGCDREEAASRQQIEETFRALLPWMQAARRPPRRIQLHMIGPELPELQESSCIEMKPEGSVSNENFEVLRISVHKEYYHEWRSQNSFDASRPHFLLAFHPGFWGYSTWKPTLDWLAERKESIPLVLTSYTLMEAEEDEEVLKRLPGATNLWSSEYNPFASHKERPTKTAVEGEEYRENSAWQAWRI